MSAPQRHGRGLGHDLRLVKICAAAVHPGDQAVRLFRRWTSALAIFQRARKIGHARHSMSISPFMRFPRGSGRCRKFERMPAVSIFLCCAVAQEKSMRQPAFVLPRVESSTKSGCRARNEAGVQQLLKFLRARAEAGVPAVSVFQAFAATFMSPEDAGSASCPFRLTHTR